VGRAALPRLKFNTQDEAERQVLEVGIVSRNTTG